MARFYRTASANPLDYMFRLNTPLMERVLATNEQYITENLNQLTQLETLADTFPHLQVDSDRAKAIASDYTKRIDSVASAIRANPADYREQMGSVRSLGKDLLSNYRTGEISKISGNYNLYKKTSDYIDKQVEQFNKDGKGISADRAKAYKQHFLSRFTSGTGYNSDTGDYNTIQVFDPMNNMDIRKSLSEELDKMKADGSIRITDEISGTGEYFNKETNKWEGITPERILRIATDRLNNPQLMEYLKQDTQAGIIKGVFDTDQNSPTYGRMIAPYNYEKVGINSTEQKLIDQMKKQIDKTTNRNTRSQLEAQLEAYTNKLNERSNLVWNGNSYLAPILRGIVGEYSYSKTEQGNNLTANPIWQTRYNQTQQNERSRLDRNQRQTLQDERLEHAKTMQDDQQEFDREMKLLEWANKPVPGAKKGDTTKPKTGNAAIGTTYTTPYYWTSQDKDNLSISLNNEIESNKHAVSKLEQALGDIVKTNPDDKIMIANAENQLNSAKVKLSTLENQRENALGFAINEWKAKGESRKRGTLDMITGENAPVPYSEYNETLLRSFLSGKARQELEDANENLASVTARLRQTNDTQTQNEYRLALNKKAAAENIYTSGARIFSSEVKSYTDSKLEKAAQETTNSNTIISTTDAQDQRIIDMVNTTPSNYKIVGSDGKETTLSFEHGTATTDPKKFKINGVSATTGLGDKQIEISANINGKNVIIIPKDDGSRLTNYFANEFKQSKDPEVKNIGSILGNPTAATIMDMLTEVRMNTGTSYGTKDAWIYKTIPNPANPRETVKIRARSISTGGGAPKWEVQFETGNAKLITQNSARGAGTGFNLESDGSMKGFVPLSSTRSLDGVYHNLEDILSIFPTN